MKRSAWYDGVPDARTRVECSGTTHAITWRRGKLLLEDHDPQAEATLVALGGEPPFCYSLLDAWRVATSPQFLAFVLQVNPGAPAGSRAARAAQAVVRARVVTQTSRSTRWAVSLASTQPSHLVGSPLRHAADVEGALLQRRLVALSSLPAPLHDILRVCAILAVERRADGDPAMGILHRTVAPRILADKAVPALRSTLEATGRRLGPRTTIRCFVIPSWEPPTLDGWAVRGGAGAALSLPLSWLARVWARGLAVVGGSFILRVTPAPDGSLRALAARWESHVGRILPVVRPARLVRTDGEWVLCGIAE